MTTRTIIQAKITVGNRTVTVTAMDAVGVEDCYSNAIAGVLHRYVTSEDLVMPVPREIKDWIIKQNLTI